MNIGETSRPAPSHSMPCARSRQPALLHKRREGFLFESSMVAGEHEQLVPYEVQDQELAFVQHRIEATRFTIYLA